MKSIMQFRRKTAGVTPMFLLALAGLVACSEPPPERVYNPATDLSSALAPASRRYEQYLFQNGGSWRRPVPILVRFSDGTTCTLASEAVVALVPNEHFTDEIWSHEEWNHRLTNALLAKTAILEKRIDELQRADPPQER